MANKLDIRHNLPTDNELGRIFNAVPILERHKVADKVLTAGAQPIVKRARQLAPRSSQEDRDKRSAKQRASGDWDYPLWKTIKRVIRKYRTGGYAVIGPEWPKGNKAYFNTSPSGRRQVLWGRPTGRTVAAVRNWIAQAFDETRGAQLTQMKAKLKSLMQDIWTQ